MSKLIAVVLVGALAAVVFYRRKNQESWGSTWSSANDSRSSWGETAAHEPGKAADRAAETADDATAAASNLADDVKDGNAV